VSRLARILLLAALTLCAAAPAANAAPTTDLGETLGKLWTTVLETPSPQNPFGTGGPAFACWDLNGTAAPFGPNGVKSCTVTPDTPIFVAASTHECSSFPDDHGIASDKVFGTTEPELRLCASYYDVQVAPTVTVDGNSVPVTQVETQPLSIALPQDNIFGVQSPTERHGLSVAHGWVTLLQPLTLGKHTIVINRNTFPTITTTIKVKQAH
jgi:hypothetical protein